MLRNRAQVGRTQVGGLSLLLAVALLAAAGSGAETARRVAFTGAGLAYAMVAEAPHAVLPDPQDARSLALSGITLDAPHNAVQADLDQDWIARLVAGGFVDLPPPSAGV